ncbi:WD-repeat protein [Aduncisulcus paluster]|uniref:WD-repeat protein n=1 Tax=Aduncisulcus paluster TaxID=2918883 RepID=A0ABQ5K1S1_9EUKA|nr:WD-repeat protein [Aduncisulcus paluster]|eukprot:gnl/Carplike_NY0171/11970_a17163_115.p1 GENE.gnl/Carplike_NY0171/11970_a17163_115~~gnl/Carplike_NY0171/11970_a17163_115.p1  ORF type:complete len:403 (+),score=62.64 gnl/Carplike_NY0171/11970_a17163_115:1-1209(+)
MKPRDGPQLDGKKTQEHVDRDYFGYRCAMIRGHRSLPHTRYCPFGNPLIPSATHPLAKYYEKYRNPHMFTRSSPMDGVLLRLAHASRTKPPDIWQAIRWAPRGMNLVAGTFGGELYLWKDSTFNFDMKSLPSYADCERSPPIYHIEWTHDKRYLLSADDAGRIVLNNELYKEVWLLKNAHQGAIRSFSISPTDECVAYGGAGGHVRLLNLKTGKKEGSMPGHRDEVRKIFWHHSSSLVVSGSKDESMKLWDTRIQRCIANLLAHKGSVEVAAFVPVGNKIVSAGVDMKVKLWDIRTLKVIKTLEVPETSYDYLNRSRYRQFSESNHITCISFHPFCQNVCACGTHSGDILYYDLFSGTELGRVRRAHRLAIWDVDYHPAGYVLATASKDKDLRFWSSKYGLM